MRHAGRVEPAQQCDFRLLAREKGGKVDANTIRCRFQGWRYEGDHGKRVEIPYAKRIPPRAELEMIPSLECNGMIPVWHHREGMTAEWKPEVIPELLDPDYVLH